MDDKPKQDKELIQKEFYKIIEVTNIQNEALKKLLSHLNHGIKQDEITTISTDKK